ncbi:MAG: hypothetical protein QNJ45_24425 [Ardenticatenaceae bacterium]|nr:hypothetical protein [Ardenticatenaceae bacterium]
MTTRRKSNDSFLKSVLVVGSILATFFAGELIANRPAVNPSSAPQIVIGGELQYEAGTPRMAIPRPVASSRSSR